MPLKDYLPEAKINIRTSGFSAPESVHRRLDALVAHYNTTRSELIGALVNRHFDEMVEAKEMTPETIASVKETDK